MYAQLGTTIFDTLFSFDSFKKETETKYAEIPIVGGKPDLQRTSLTLDIIALSIKLHNSFCDPVLRYRELENYRINGDILPFLDGYGNLIGNFVIAKITETVEQTDGKGAVTCCTCEVELKEYVNPDRLEAAKQAAQRSAFAIDNGSTISDSITLITNNLKLPAKADVFLSMQSVNANGDATQSAIDSALSTPSEQGNFLNKAHKAVDAVSQAVADTQSKMTQYVSTIVSPIGFAASLTAVANTAAALAIAIRTGDISNLSADMSLLSGAINGMNTSSLPMERLIILRQ